MLEKDDSDSTGRMNRSKRGESESSETEVIQVRGNESRSRTVTAGWKGVYTGES